jgi:hypothetical protein
MTGVEARSRSNKAAALLALHDVWCAEKERASRGPMQVRGASWAASGRLQLVGRATVADPRAAPYLPSLTTALACAVTAQFGARLDSGGTRLALCGGQRCP